MSLSLLTYSIEFIFSIALFLNAGLFVIQAWKLYQEKCAKGISLLTFFGFSLIQLATIFHGLLMRDHLLVLGYVLSFAACIVVIILTFRYR